MSLKNGNTVSCGISDAAYQKALQFWGDKPVSDHLVAPISADWGDTIIVREQELKEKVDCSQVMAAIATHNAFVS